MKLFFTLLCCITITLCQGQNKQLLYNVNELPQTLMNNPGANITFKAHIGIPFFSQFHFSAGSSGADLHDIFDDSNNNINQRIINTINRLTNNDFFTAQEQLEILSIGWKLNRDHYLSAGVYQEMDAFSYFPKDPAILVAEGNIDYINYPFDFSDVSFTAEVLAVYHIGLNKIIDHKLTVGGRVKIYSGIFNVESVDNTGTLLTRRTPNGSNYYMHQVQNLDVRINTSGFASLRDDSDTQTVQDASKSLLQKTLLGGNIGGGIDLGATYKIRENLEVTGSVLDLGLIYHRKDVENYIYKGSYETSGIEPLFPEIGPDGKAFPYWDEFEDEVDRNLRDETLNEGYMTWRPFKVNASLELRFGEIIAPCDYRIRAKRKFHSKGGIHIFGIKRPGAIKYALSGYYDRKITQNLRMKVAYTFDDFSYTNIGLLASTKFKSFNFYLAADNLLGYFNLAKSRYQSVQFGFQFVVPE